LAEIPSDNAPNSPRSNRRKGRELALQALYQIEMTGDPSGAAVDLFLQHFEGNTRAKEFARRLVSGTVSQRAEIDRLIAQATEHWNATEPQHQRDGTYRSPDGPAELHYAVDAIGVRRCAAQGEVAAEGRADHMRMV
jgi:hypothetical protein